MNEQMKKLRTAVRECKIAIRNGRVHIDSRGTVFTQEFGQPFLDYIEEVLETCPEDDIAEPKVGEHWHFIVGKAIAVSTNKVVDLTPATVAFAATYYGGSPIRYCRADIRFIERAKESK